MTVGDPSMLFILCLPIQSLMCDVPFILSLVRSVRFDMIVYYRIIGPVIHPQIFILLWLLIDAVLSFSSESLCKSKGKRKSMRVSAKVLIEFQINK
jgi:hypothetical protein